LVAAPVRLIVVGGAGSLEVVPGVTLLASGHLPAPYVPIAGFAAITTDQEPEYADVGWNINEQSIVVHRLAVDPAFQGKGMAAALMLQAETVARVRGVKVLRVDTNAQNQATQRLFPKLGYALAGEIKLRFRPGLSFLCYEKRIVELN
jgi:ribosomal protein S18 acetylase RimI-like enzyme